MSQIDQNAPSSDLSSLSDLSSKRQVADWLGKNILTFDRMFKKGEFPPPIWVGGNARWRRSDILTWLNYKSQSARPDRPGTVRTKNNLGQYTPTSKTEANNEHCY